MTYLGTI